MIFLRMVKPKPDISCAKKTGHLHLLRTVWHWIQVIADFRLPIANFFLDELRSIQTANVKSKRIGNDFIRSGSCLKRLIRKRISCEACLLTCEAGVSIKPGASALGSVSCKSKARESGRKLR